MPKRAPTAYNFLTKDKELRQKIKDEHPDWNHTDIMAEYARLWKMEWTDEQRKPYEELAKKAKEEFIATEESQDGGEIETVKVKKRAKTAFIFYLYDPKVRDPVQEAHPEYKPKDLTSHISKMWKLLSDEDKKPWEDLSNKQKQEFLENPIYEEKKVKVKKPPPTQLTVDRTQQLEIMVENLQKQIKELHTLYEEKLKSVVQNSSNSETVSS
jgi:hypothetical protein